MGYSGVYIYRNCVIGKSDRLFYLFFQFNVEIDTEAESSLDNNIIK